MKKSILNIGEVLSKAAQKSIHGGRFICCNSNPICPPYNETSCIVIAGTCHFYGNEGVSC